MDLRTGSLSYHFISTCARSHVDVTYLGPFTQRKTAQEISVLRFGFGERKSSRRTSREKNTKKVRSDPIKNLIRQILCAMRDACWPSQSKFEGDLLLTIVAAVDKRSDSLRS